MFNACKGLPYTNLEGIGLCVSDHTSKRDEMPAVVTEMRFKTTGVSLSDMQVGSRAHAQWTSALRLAQTPGASWPQTSGWRRLFWATSLLDRPPALLLPASKALPPRSPACPPTKLRLRLSSAGWHFLESILLQAVWIFLPGSSCALTSICSHAALGLGRSEKNLHSFDELNPTTKIDWYYVCLLNIAPAPILVSCISLNL